MTFEKPNQAVYLTGRYQCPVENPYLVLDSAKDNSSQLFRRTTYNTGDGEHLGLLEYAIPLTGPLGTFLGVDMTVQLKKLPLFSGHKSFTIYCASTLEAAHQK